MIGDGRAVAALARDGDCIRRDAGGAFVCRRRCGPGGGVDAARCGAIGGADADERAGHGDARDGDKTDAGRDRERHATPPAGKHPAGGGQGHTGEHQDSLAETAEAVAEAIGLRKQAAEQAAKRQQALVQTTAAIDSDIDFKDAKLSPREREVLSLYASGLSQKQIAFALDIKPSTVKEHIDRVRVKYADVGRPVTDKTAFLKRALEDGLLE